jgi:hypothetical protein
MYLSVKKNFLYLKRKKIFNNKITPLPIPYNSIDYNES